MDVVSRVRMMAMDVTKRIRGWLPQNFIPIIGEGGEFCWGRVGISMQGDVDVANRSQDMECHPQIIVLLRFAKKMIPECAELVL